MPEEQSSIQRFLQNRATQILVSPGQKIGSTAQIAIGGACIAIGAGLFVAGALTRIYGLMFGALGPFVAGVVNLGLGLALRKRFSQTQVEVKLSSEARIFLWNLIRQTGTGWNRHQNHWNSWGGWTSWTGPTGSAGQNQGASFLMQLGKHWGFVPKTPKDVLPKQLHDVLETACYHYNRAYGLLETGKSESSVAKIAPTARSAADEALFAILHHAATMSRYPETAPAASRDCEGKIRALKELADGLEHLQTRPTTITDRIGYTSAMDSALEELRLERLAREELSNTAKEEPHLRERL